MVLPSTILPLSAAFPLCAPVPLCEILLFSPPREDIQRGIIGSTGTRPGGGQELLADILVQNHLSTETSSVGKKKQRSKTSDPCPRPADHYSSSWNKRATSNAGSGSICGTAANANGRGGVSAPTSASDTPIRSFLTQCLMANLR